MRFRSTIVVTLSLLLGESKAWTTVTTPCCSDRRQLSFQQLAGVIVERQPSQARWSSSLAATVGDDNDELIVSEDDDEEEEEEVPATTEGGDEDDFDCEGDDEDGCEIDWDAMPGMAADPAVDHEAESEPVTTAAVEYNDFEFDLEEEEDDDEEEEDDDEADLEQSMERTRKSLEMQWGMTQSMEECNIEKQLHELERQFQVGNPNPKLSEDSEDHCGSDQCTDCKGSGERTCRFCQGTRMLPFYGPNGSGDLETYSCKICNPQGKEVCPTCRGTGWIAGWTLPRPADGRDEHETVPRSTRK